MQENLITNYIGNDTLTKVPFNDLGAYVIYKLLTNLLYSILN